MKYNNYLCMISGRQNDPKSKCNSRRHLTENKGHSGGRFGGGGGGGGGGNSQECHRNYQGQSYGQVKCGACSSRTKTFNYIILFLFLQFLLVF